MRFLYAILISLLLLAGFVLGGAVLLSPPDASGKRSVAIHIDAASKAATALDWPAQDGPALKDMVIKAEHGDRSALYALQALYVHVEPYSPFMNAYFYRVRDVLKKAMTKDTKLKRRLEEDCHIGRGQLACDIVLVPTP